MTKRRAEEDSLLQRQARALGDPTRYRIFRYVADSPAPARVAAITDHHRLSDHNVRLHLAKLRDAGLLIEEQVSQNGPGRPPLEYRLAPAAAGAWGTPSPYEQLALLLLDLHRSGLPPREVGAAAGRLAPSRMPGQTGVDHLEAEMARRGFEPQRVRRRSVIDLVLNHCPFATLASADPSVICELHLGLAEGIAEAGGAVVEVTTLVRRDPKKAGCRVQVPSKER